MDLVTFNLLLSTLGPAVVVGGVAGTVKLLLKAQDAYVGEVARGGEADVRAAEREWLQKRSTSKAEPARAGV